MKKIKTVIDLWEEEAKAKGFKNTAEYVQSFNQFERIKKAKEFQKKIYKPNFHVKHDYKSLITQVGEYIKLNSVFSTKDLTVSICGEFREDKANLMRKIIRENFNLKYNNKIRKFTSILILSIFMVSCTNELTTQDVDFERLDKGSAGTSEQLGEGMKYDYTNGVLTLYSNAMPTSGYSLEITSVREINGITKITYIILKPKENLVTFAKQVAYESILVDITKPIVY